MRTLHSARRTLRCAQGGLLYAALLSLTPVLAGFPQARLTQEEALRLTFPAPATIERRTAFLSNRDQAAVSDLAGPDVEMSQSVVTYYVGRRDTIVTAIAFFDSHIVRSMQQVVMVVVGPEGSVRSVEILRFDEPPDYRAPPGWLAQFRAKSLNDGLSLKGQVRNLTGATLTSRAIVRSVRRILALHRVIDPLHREP